MSFSVTANANQLFTTTTPTITAAASGNLLIMWFAGFRNAGARTISSISTTNVTWTNVAAVTNSSMRVEIWKGVVAGGSSGTAVTITMSGTGATVCGRITEFTPSDNGLDGTAVTATGTSVTPATGNYSEATTQDLVLACAGWANGTAPTASPGQSVPWTDATFANNSTTVGCAGAYILVGSAPVTYAPSWTITSAVWGAVIEGVKATVATPGTEVLHPTEELNVAYYPQLVSV